MGAHGSGRGGIPPHKALAIARLLARGALAKSQIAALQRVGRDTVYRINRGTHWSCRPGALRFGLCCECGREVFETCLVHPLSRVRSVPHPLLKRHLSLRQRNRR